MAKIARHSGLGVSIAITPLRCSRLAASLIISGRRSGGMCSTTCEQKIPSSDAFGQILQILENVGLLRVEPLVPADRDRFVAQVDAAPRNLQVAQQFQEFAAPAPEIENIRACPRNKGR